MQSKTIPNAPAFSGGYVPYFYESGLHQLYLKPPHHAPQDAQGSSHSRYDFSSDAIPSHPFERPQSVEQIVARGYFAAPAGAPETAIISDRKHTAWLGLDDVIQQVRWRHGLYEQTMHELDLAVCEANSAVFRQEADQGGPANEKQRYAANKMIQDIYEQKRAERLTLWRDVSKLKLALPEIAQQYLSAYRKSAILEDTQGDPR